MVSKGKCKYCHLPGHVIDKCPTIICKHCKSIGHPNWLCPGNPNAESPISPIHPQSPGLRNKNSMYGFESTNSLKGSSVQLAQLDQLSPKKSMYGDFKNEFKEKMKNKEEVKKEEVKKEELQKEVINVMYYQKIIQAKWGDLV
jgi:hypothetical protein